MFKLLFILDIIKLPAHINVYEVIVNWYWIHNLLEDLNPLKSQMISNNSSDARLFLINGTNHLMWILQDMLYEIL